MYLVEAGLITPAQVELALNDQKVDRRRLGEILADRGWVKPSTIEYLMKKVVLPEQRAVEKKSHPGKNPSQNLTASGQASLGQRKFRDSLAVTFCESKVFDQLVYTSFARAGFKVLTSARVTMEIQLAFTQMVYRHWDSYNPPSSEYQAAYLHQVTPEHSLFGWLYNDETDDFGRKGVPYFLCYYLADRLDAVQLENIFNCLQKGPVALTDRHSATLETIVAPDLWSYQPVRRGLTIPASVRKHTQAALKERRLLDLFVEVDKQKIAIELNKQILPQEEFVQPLVTLRLIPQSSPAERDSMPAFQGNQTSNASVPTSGNKSAFIIGISTGVASALLIIALMFWLYYLLKVSSTR